MSEVSKTEFGDDTPDDVVTAGDDEVNWEEVDVLEEQIEEIEDIDDDQERLEAAIDWAAELEGAD